MALVEHAEKELELAGWMKKGEDEPYYGEIGPSVLELVKVFAAQGHSGGSAPVVIELFSRVAKYQPLTKLKNPMLTGEYIDHSDSMGGNPVLQSTRRSSVFSDDGGKTWHDIDKKVVWWKRVFGVRRHYLSFE